MGGHSSETVVQVQQTATQTQETNVGSQDLTKIIDSLLNVFSQQAQNPVSPTIVPIWVTGTQGQAEPTAQADQVKTDPETQQPQQYNNAEVSQLLAMMYYNVLKGQQEVQEPSESPINLTTIFIVAAVIIITIFIWKGK